MEVITGWLISISPLYLRGFCNITQIIFIQQTMAKASEPAATDRTLIDFELDQTSDCKYLNLGQYLNQN